MTDKTETWLQTKWRPITAVVYLVICITDFILFPILWSFFLYFIEATDKSIAWDPLTLKGAGLFHLSFGAILGVSAYTRGQEKISRYKQDEYYPQYRDEYVEEDPVPSTRRPRFEPPKR